MFFAYAQYTFIMYGLESVLFLCRLHIYDAQCFMSSSKYFENALRVMNLIVLCYLLRTANHHTSRWKCEENQNFLFFKLLILKQLQRLSRLPWRHINTFRFKNRVRRLKLLGNKTGPDCKDLLIFFWIKVNSRTHFVCEPPRDIFE